VPHRNSQNEVADNAAEKPGQHLIEMGRLAQRLCHQCGGLAGQPQANDQNSDCPQNVEPVGHNQGQQSVNILCYRVSDMLWQVSSPVERPRRDISSSGESHRNETAIRSWLNQS
jgi:hypothetical protein